jgi:alcohol dehydrogenase class IV
MWEPNGIYSKFSLKIPPILFGVTAINGLKNFPVAKVAIIHGKALTEEQKSKISNTIPAFDICFILKSWEDEPELKLLKKTIAIVEAFKPDLFIAIGGGSVIDGTKLVRVFYEFPYIEENNSNFNLLNFSTKFIAIPTTIGSGAEISSASVLYNPIEKTKEFFIAHAFIPDVIILDSEFIIKASDNILFSSMIDSLSHIIEGYVSIVENQIADIYAEKALQIISQKWKIFKKTRDPLIAVDLQLASLWAGLVQNHCIVGAAHGLAHQMSAYHFSHSTAISLVLPAVIKRNSNDDKVNMRYKKLINAAGIKGETNGLIEMIEEITYAANNISEKSRFKNYLPNIINDTNFISNAIKDKGAQGNPIPLSENFYMEILETL